MGQWEKKKLVTKGGRIGRGQFRFNCDGSVSGVRGKPRT